MQITIKHRCGTERTFWAPTDGGYVHVIDSQHPGTTGWQPTIRGATLTCGPTEESLRRAVRRWVRYQTSGGELCPCGGYPGH